MIFLLYSYFFFQQDNTFLAKNRLSPLTFFFFFTYNLSFFILHNSLNQLCPYSRVWNCLEVLFILNCFKFLIQTNVQNIPSWLIWWYLNYCNLHNKNSHFSQKSIRISNWKIKNFVYANSLSNSTKFIKLQELFLSIWIKDCFQK